MKNFVIKPLVAVLILATSTGYAALVPPSANRVLWLAADTGLSANGSSTVTAWNDAGTSSNMLATVVDAPKLATGSFPNGSHAVVRFDGNDGINLVDTNSLDLASLSVYVVGGLSNADTSRIFITNFGQNASFTTNGWATGISDAVAARVKWFTALPGDSLDGGSSSQSTGLLVNSYYMMTSTYDGNTTKTLAIQTSINSGLTLSHYAGSPFTANDATAINMEAGVPLRPVLGYLRSGPGAAGTNSEQFLRGDIAEILVYSGADATSKAAVEAYLAEKYFLVPVPEPTSLTCLVLGLPGLLFCARRSRRRRMQGSIRSQV